MNTGHNPVHSKKRLDRILNYARKRRTLSLRIAFPLLMLEDVFTGKKPHELLPPHVSSMAVIGTALILSGGFLRFWARGHFAKGRLFTTGPYAAVRHPLYLGSLFVVLGVLLMLNDWLNWLVVLPLLAAFYGAAIIREERSLQNKFGTVWAQYKANVPAIIPSLRRHLPVKCARGWSWAVFSKTGELPTFVAVVALPLFIELIEECAFK